MSITLTTDGDPDKYLNGAGAYTTPAGNSYIIASDVTYTIGTGGDFATLHDARDFLKGKLILPNVIVTLHGLDEIHNYTTTYTHDLGEQVNYTGVEYALGFTSIDSIVTNSAGDHIVTFNVTSSANCAVGRFIKLRGLAGTGEYETLEGIWPITAVPSGTQVSVKVTDQRGSIAATTISSMQEFRVIKTVYKFTGCTGLKIEGKLGTIDRLAGLGVVIQGDETTTDTYGIYGNDGAEAYLSSTKFGVYGFKDHNVYGFRAGHISFSSIASCNSGGHGVYLLNSAQGTGVRAILNGNKLDGLAAAASAQVEGGYLVTCGNGSDGISASTGGSFVFSGKSKYNVGKAINACNADVFISGADIKGEVYLKDCRGHANTSTIDGALNIDSVEVAHTGNTVSGETYGEEKALSGSNIHWTGTAPSGTENHRYQFRRVADRVDFTMRLDYSSAGSGLTFLTIDLPSDMPTPAAFTGMANGDFGYSISGMLCISNTALPTASRPAHLFKNSSGVWQIAMSGTSAAFTGASFSGHYYI